MSFRSLAAVAVAASAVEGQYVFGSSTGIDGWVADHNYFRCRHGASPVKWDADLAKSAQAWAAQLNKDQRMYHSDSFNIQPYSGENLAWGQGTFTCGPNGGKKQPYGQACAVWNWYNEYNLFLGASKTDSTAWETVSGAGHFTAMAWKGINIIGCGVSGVYHVCHYSHDLCKTSKAAACTGTSPPHLPNYNISKCQPGVCLESAKPQYEAKCSASGSNPTNTTLAPTVIVPTPTALPPTTPTPTTTIASAPSSGAETNAFGKYTGPAGYVADHNYFRCRHGAAPLKWDADLANSAQTWANQLNKDQRMYHSDSFNIVPYSGENLAWGYGSTTCGPNGGTTQEYSQHCPVWVWYNEYNKFLSASQTDGTAWKNVSGVAHFTAMVWKGINSLGCAKSGVYYVCHYSNDLCKTSKGAACTGTAPPGLPNFNIPKCQPGVCLESAKPEYAAQCSGGTWPRRLQAEEELVETATEFIVVTTRAPLI